jgi:hypothetical protein
LENSTEQLIRESAAANFASVRCLLAAGASERLLAWSTLHHAVALGTLAQVDAALRESADLEQRDHAQRTALLLAVQVGDLEKMELLLLYGAEIQVRAGGKPAIFFALEQADLSLFDWMLSADFPLGLDDRGVSLLAHALEHGHYDSVRQRLDARFADSHRQLASGKSSELVRLKESLIAGADPRGLDYSLQRLLIGLPESSAKLYSATAEDYLAAAEPRFGQKNPELRKEKFLYAMLHSGVDGYTAGIRYNPELGRHRGPIWNAHRHGQSITFLPDGRILQIGGEHEDWYDPDFCIYNDVFVHYPDGRHEIYSYPPSVFPPTDFHSATLVGPWIWIIGCAGYKDQRCDMTPVYLLNTETLKIRRLQISGESPGWIHGHQALLTSKDTIRIEIDRPRHQVRELDIRKLRWKEPEAD